MNRAKSLLKALRDFAGFFVWVLGLGFEGEGCWGLNERGVGV